MLRSGEVAVAVALERQGRGSLRVVIPSTDRLAVGLALPSEEVALAGRGQRQRGDDLIRVRAERRGSARELGAGRGGMDSPRDLGVPWCVVGEDDVAVPAGRFTSHHHHLLLGPDDVVEGELADAVVVDDGVGDLWPGIDEIPPDESPTSSSSQPRLFDEELLRLRLTHLRGEDDLAQIVGLAIEVEPRLVEHQLVPAVIPVGMGAMVGLMQTPYGVVGDRGRRDVRQELSERPESRHAVVTDLAHELRHGARVERRFERCAGAPEVLLGNALPLLWVGGQEW